ncbi:MAG: TolC family protein [Alphaproteobacteria bacterium]|nr:TolC family protein [Alphaproteobacteria bacterium]
MSKVFLRGASALALAIAVAGCTVSPVSLSEAESQARLAETMAAISRQPLPAAPITLHEAMARALKFNFESRVKLMEEEIANNRLDATFWNFLPQSIVSAGRSARSNTAASSSRSVQSGQESLEMSTSQENVHNEADARFTWNALDLGVSYFTARQMANQTLIAAERRKRAIRQLMQEVRDAYWKAVGAQRLLGQVEQILTKVREAVDKADAIESERLENPMEILGYKRDLYTKLTQLQTLRRTLLASKLDLAKMMNLPASTSYQVVVPEGEPPSPKKLAIPIGDLEIKALMTRPELIEESYHERIAVDEGYKAIARMLPGVELSASGNYNSNRYLLHNAWGEVGLKATWNLLNFMSGWTDIEMADKQKELAVFRRQALGVAVLTQVNLAFLDYREAAEGYETATRILAINQRIEKHQKNQSGERNMGEMELLQMQLTSLLSLLKKDEQYAQVQNALNRLVFSVGEEIYPDIPSEAAIPDLANALAKADGEWMRKGWFAL